MKWAGLIVPFVGIAACKEFILLDAHDKVDASVACYGKYGRVRVCSPIQHHMNSFSNNESLPRHSLFQGEYDGELVMIEKAKVDLDNEDRCYQWKNEVSSKLKQQNIRILYEEKEMFIVSISSISMDFEMKNLLTLLPRETTILPLPASPVEENQVEFSVPETTAEQEKQIRELIGWLNADEIRKDALYLTGENSDIITRHSYSKDIGVIATWLTNRFLSYGFFTTHHYYKESWGPNIIATLAGEIGSKDVIIVGAHYDDRYKNISDPQGRAPGANDDGSGTAMILALARAISQSKAKFKHTIKLCLFSGEEQGLVGSRALARVYKDHGVQVSLMIQGDMLGYRKPGEPLQTGFASRYASPASTEFAKTITEKYVPELVTGYTQVCCSDQQSFHELGFPATFFFERAGNLVDPEYHSSEDKVERLGYDVEQIKLIAKGILATAASKAEIK